MRGFSVKRLTLIAIMSAISGLLYCFLKFNVPIFPQFLDINFSMIPIIIVAFMLGPVDATIVVLIRFLIKIILVGSSTAYVGELADIIICVPTVIACGSIYNYTNIRFKELLSFLSIPVVWVVCSLISNKFINIPFYSQAYGIDAIIGLSGDAFKLITFGKIDSITPTNFMKYYLLFAVIPFNLLLSIVVIVITLPVHKRLKVLYDKFEFKANKKNKNSNIEDEAYDKED